MSWEGNGFLGIKQSYRNIRRRQQIVGVLIKNGLGYVVQRFGLTAMAPMSSRSEVISSRKETHILMAQKLRKTMEELGPTFIKLGQVLSTRPDLLPPPYIEQMERLQDKVPPMSYGEVVQQLEQELGHPDNVFKEFDWQPLAAASIGQVHRARLKSGERVIVKIQRPGIERQVENDLQILLTLARFSERRSGEARRLNVAAMIEDYAKMFLRELDYAREARSTEIVHNNFAGDDRVIIPRVYWEYTTGKILTEEYIEGVKLNDIEEIKRRNWDVRKISQLGTETFLTQIVFHGFFQADPHPGNIFIVNEHQICFIDFGQIGTLTESRLINIGELILGIGKQDMERAVSALRAMGILDNVKHNPEDFLEDFSDMVINLSTGGLGRLDMNRLRKDILTLAYNYQLKLPAYWTSLMKALITVEGVGKTLDPDYDFMETAAELANKVYKERLKPENVYKHLNRRYYRDIKPLGTLPRDLHDVIKSVGQGHLQINIKVDLSQTAHHKMSQLVSRLSSSLIITGGLIGSSLIVHGSHPDILEQYSIFGVAGFALAGIGLLFFLVLSMKS
ncbi:MAG: AarF/ABC1/UbiB kinase family protein [Syntrophomonadaceae bacterium]|jgi:ubiquinone biosynthesis protein|nr:AarF/ABC1/UbiB kinase family protein [Syntrophomonadaceae bacterium]